MKRILVGIFLGIFLVLSGGGIDFSLSLPIRPLNFLLMTVGSVSVVVALEAAVVYLRQKLRSRQDFRLPIMAVVASPIEQALTPPDKWPMAQWNPAAVSGWEAWMYVLLAVVAWVVLYRGLVAFLHGCSWRNRPRCNGSRWL